MPGDALPVGEAGRQERAVLEALDRAAAARSAQERADRDAESAAATHARLPARVRRAVIARLARTMVEARGLPLAALPLAEGGPARWLTEVTIGGIARPALQLDPPASLVWEVEVPAGAALHGWLALRPAAWGICEAGVTLTVSVSRPGGTLAGAARFSIDPRRHVRDRGWVPWRWRLPEAGPLRLHLSTAPRGGASPDYCWALAGDLRIELPRLRAARSRPVVARGPAVAPAGAPSLALLLPVHDPEPALLDATLASVLAQDDRAWQLCITDDGSRDAAVRDRLARLATADPRVCLVRHEAARGISAATNAALALADAEYVATLDHDDLLAPDAVGAVRAALADDPATDVLYSDNDLVAGDRCFSAALKPGWSPDLLHAVMYTLHLGVYRRALVQEVGGWRPEFDGAQDHDLVLRLSERTTAIRHLPRLLYHWRAHAGSAALGELAKPAAYDRGREAIAEHLKRTGDPGTVERLPEAGRYRVRRPRRAAVTVLIAVRPGEEVQLEPSVASLQRLLRDGDRIAVLPVATPDFHAGPHEGATLLAAAPSLGEALTRVGRSLHPAHTVLILEAPLDAADDALDELCARVEAGAAAAGGLVSGDDGRLLAGALAFPTGLAIPLHPDAVAGPHVPPSLTVASNRTAVRGAVALRAGALTARELAPLDRLAAAAASEAAGERVVFSPHARFTARGAAATGLLRWPVAEVLALDRGAQPDPFWNPLRWCDRGDESYPQQLHDGALGEAAR